MDPKGKGMVVNDKEESSLNEPRDDKPTDSGSSHKKRDGKKMSHPALRNKARCISYMRQEDNIYNN
jgi:hypothetical protein